MPTTTLRKLAALYHEGELSKESYREQRAQTLDGLVSGTRPHHAQRDAMPAARSLSAMRARLPVLLAVAAVAVAGGLIWALVSGPPPGSGDGYLTVTADRPGRGGPALLMEDFLRDTDWGAESMSEFLRGWMSYSEEQRRAARGLTGFRRLADAVNQQIDQERALVDLGPSDESVRQLRRLIAFAQALDLPIRALDESGRPGIAHAERKDRQPAQDFPAYVAPSQSWPPHAPDDSTVRPSVHPQG